MQDFIDGETLEVKAPADTPIVQAIVTPAVATKWLATQKKNRNVQKIAMLAYRSDMTHGRWTYTADPIRFDWDGHLIDGQNRLEALAGIKARKFAVPFAVARGLDPESQMYMDQGARRTAGQQLALDGIGSGSSIAAGIKMALVWERGQLFSDRWRTANPVTHIEVIEWAQTHRELVALAQSYMHRIRSIGLRPSSGISFVIRVGHSLPDEVELFFTEMHTLENLSAGSPTLAFAKRVARTRQDANLHLSDVDQLGFLIRTWNSWVNGSTRLRLQLPSGGWTAENFPRVEGL
jgi:hypothetical protein